MPTPRPLTAEQSALVSRHFPLACKMARRYSADYPGLQDEIEEASCDGLMIAATVADPSRPFPQLARKIIRDSIVDRLRSELRRSRRIRAQVRLVDYLVESGQPAVGRDSGPLPEELLDQVDAFEALLGRFRQCDREMLRLIFLHGLSQVEAAPILGVSLATLKRRLYRVLRSYGDRAETIPFRRDRSRPEPTAPVSAPMMA